MKSTIRTIVVSVSGTLVLSWHTGGSSQEPNPATEPDASVTQEGLHRVDPSIMEAAWVKPDFDLSGYTRIMLMPTAVQFRDVPETSIDARTRAMTEEFPLTDERKEWFRGLWRESVEARFAREESYEFFVGVDSNVLVVQGFLVDVVSRIPPIAPGSTYTFAKDSLVSRHRPRAAGMRRPPSWWRAPSISDTRKGLLEVGTVWYLTEDLVERWAEALSERLGPTLRAWRDGPARRRSGLNDLGHREFKASESARDSARQSRRLSVA